MFLCSAVLAPSPVSFLDLGIIANSLDRDSCLSELDGTKPITVNWAAKPIQRGRDPAGDGAEQEPTVVVTRTIQSPTQVQSVEP